MATLSVKTSTCAYKIAKVENLHSLSCKGNDITNTKIQIIRFKVFAAFGKARWDFDMLRL